MEGSNRNIYWLTDKATNGINIIIIHNYACT